MENALAGIEVARLRELRDSLMDIAIDKGVSIANA